MTRAPTTVQVLWIGGVRFLISTSRPIAMVPPDRPYPLFRRPPSSAAAPAMDVRVRLELDAFPKLLARERVFESGEAWSLYRRGNSRFLLQTPHGGAAPGWCARFSSGRRSVVVYCAPGMWQARARGARLWNPMTYPLDLVLVMYLLAGGAGVVIHGAGVEIAGRGYVFAGRSGAGKSTISRQFLRSRNARVLSDDRVVVRVTPRGLELCGTPWLGTAAVSRNRTCPLAGFFFLRHGSKNQATPITAAAGMEALLPVVSIPWFDRDMVAPMLALVDRMAAEVPMFDLSFRPTPAIARDLSGWVRGAGAPGCSRSAFAATCCSSYGPRKSSRIPRGLLLRL